MLPASGVLGATGLTVRSLVAGPLRGTGIAAAKGGFKALVWVPRLLRERRQLRGRFAERLDVWLARTAGRVLLLAAVNEAVEEGAGSDDGSLRVNDAVRTEVTPAG